MRITRDQVIAGLPALRAREFARDLVLRGGRGCRRDWLIGFLTDYGADRLSRAEAQRFVDAFVAGGYAEAVPGGDDDLRTTVAGNALAMATARRPVLRRSADKAVGELVERAAAINADPGYVYMVEWLELFGSYLNGDVDRLGDVDVYFRLARRYDGDEHLLKARERSRQAERTGRSFPTFESRLTWPYTEVMRALRGNSAIISLVGTPPELLGAASKVIFSSEETPAVSEVHGATV
jgi:hypothetical protein